MNAAGDGAVWTNPVQAMGAQAISSGNPNDVGGFRGHNPGDLIITPTGIWQCTDQVAAIDPADVGKMYNGVGWFQVYASVDATAVKTQIKAAAAAGDWTAFKNAIDKW
jgi:hypothetical protein